MNRISLGARIKFGDQGREQKLARVDSLYLSGLDAYATGNIEDAERYWNEALSINPKFDPAKEGLALIQHSSMLDTRINNMQSLDSYE